MDDLREKIFELASQDEEFAKRLVSAETLEAAADLLREKGLDVTAEDLMALEQPEASGAAKLSDDELDAVAGGGACACVGNGAGTKSGDDDWCGCVCLGQGYDIYDNGRCLCVSIGGGTSHTE